jgi:ribosomal protein S1
MKPNSIVRGEVVRLDGDDVWIEVSPKMQAPVPLQEFYDETQDAVVPLHPGEVAQGLLVAISFQAGPVTRSVNAFLPESEAGIPNPAYLDELLGWTIECEVIEIDAFLGNIVLSRRRRTRRAWP